MNALLEVVENGSMEALRKAAFYGFLVLLRIVFGGYGFLVLLPVLTQDRNIRHGSSTEDESGLEEEDTRQI